MKFGAVVAIFCVICFAGAARAQHVSCQTNYYSLKGETVRELHESMRAMRRTGRVSHDGVTVWNVNWRFGTVHNGSSCRLGNFSTTTTISITLPRWIAPTNASDVTKAEWARYIKALGEHEYGHAQFALIAAGEIQKRVRQIGEDAS